MKIGELNLYLRLYDITYIIGEWDLKVDALGFKRTVQSNDNSSFLIFDRFSSTIDHWRSSTLCCLEPTFNEDRYRLDLLIGHSTSTPKCNEPNLCQISALIANHCMVQYVVPSKQSQAA